MHAQHMDSAAYNPSGREDCESCDLQFQLLDAGVADHNRLTIVIAVARQGPERPRPRFCALLLQEILDVAIQLPGIKAR